MNISKNAVVTLNYTLKNSEGTVMDTSDGREPLVYLHGVGGLIEGLETELEGKPVGEKMSLEIPADKAYGEKQEDLLRVVSKDGFQGDEEMQVGMQVQLETDHGPAIAIISKIDDTEVTLDLNHPLAGMTLFFDIEVVEVREATEEEIEHGHVHGPGGHQH